MKATGIIRRIDGLGRIIIPKEIRQTLKINEWDALEVYSSDDGVFFKKYSLMAANLDTAQTYIRSLHKVIYKPIIITDTDKIIAMVKDNANCKADCLISEDLKDIILKREVVTDAFLKIAEHKNAKVNIVYPILSEGDVIGSIIVLAASKDEEVTELETALIKVAANYLGNV